MTNKTVASLSLAAGMALGSAGTALIPQSDEPIAISVEKFTATNAYPPFTVQPWIEDIAETEDSPCVQGVRGRLVMGQNRMPMAGAVLEVVAKGMPEGAERLVARTVCDPDGRFLVVVPSNVGQVDVYFSGFATQQYALRELCVLANFAPLPGCLPPIWQLPQE